MDIFMQIKPICQGSANDIGALSAPAVLKTTHHSIQLLWGTLPNETGRPKYHVKEEGFGIVYRGYATQHIFTGLKALTQYTYCVRLLNDTGIGPWSCTVTVTTDKQPRTSENLHKAINRGNLQAVKTILDENSLYIDVPDIYGSSPLMIASSQTKNNIVSLLLDMGANVEYCNYGGKTSLMEACYFGNTEGAKLIADSGASWTSRDNSGFSALHYAVDGGNLSTINYILSEGVNVDDKNECTLSGWTPLLRTATFGGKARVAQVLIEAGANVSKCDKNGKTPLMLASLNGFKDLVQLLLANGADPAVKTKLGMSAKDFAQSFNHQDAVELLESKGN
ncbi:fibronectin type 3 and ankyrin repeat domains protein 1-like [Halichondria panicea]|uniref:fibronectin type 3 and ankyrin repeat domains protein 1-like n=1 Tax=Halichondria panicea TaxID=6063 RepID=UPI00312B9ABD